MSRATHSAMSNFPRALATPQSLLIALLLAFVPLARAQVIPAEDEPTVTNKNTSESRAKKQSTRSDYNDLVMIGNDATVKEGQIAREVVVIGGSADIDGSVRHKLVVVGGTARLGPLSEIRGDLIIIGGKLEAAPGSKVGGQRIVIGTGGGSQHPWLPLIGGWMQSTLFYGRPLAHQQTWSWILAAIALLLYLVIATLFPRAINSPITALEQKPGQALLVGLLTLLLLLPLFALLTITVVGIVLIPFTLFALVVALLFGRVAVYRYAGAQVAGQFGLSTLARPLPALILGAILFCLLYMIPILGLIAWGLVLPLSLGSIMLAVLQRTRPGAGEPIAVAPAPEPAFAQPSLLLPRAGFWLRLAATLLDFVLVAVVLRIFLPHPQFFLPLWIIYHLAFWSWQQTTLGGLILGLRLVRTDGRPITFSVALVRLLGSFFSALVLGLGFFWAGWSADKQSWHDKIAGTVIVRSSRKAPAPTPAQAATA